MTFKKIIFLPLAFLFMCLPSCGPNEKVFLKVMSYNIQHGIDHKKRVEEGKTVINLDAVVNIVKKYNPDVLNINEIYEECSQFEIKEQVKYLGEQLGYNYYFVLGDVISWMDNGRYGGAILTKFPIVSKSTHPIPNPEGAPADLEKRAIGQVGIKLPNNKIINVCQSHFGGISDTEEMRDQERQNAIDTLKPLVENKENTLFMGDLNLVASNQHHQYYIRQIRDMLDETIDERAPTFDSLNPTEHIDYMFCTKDMTYRNGRVLPDVFSDHLPIMCEFDLL